MTSIKSGFKTPGTLRFFVASHSLSMKMPDNQNYSNFKTPGILRFYVAFLSLSMKMPG
jgi:hypothetical protein